jgi:hypothetical protein
MKGNVLFSLIAVSRVHFDSKRFMSLIDFPARGLWNFKCKLGLSYRSASAVLFVFKSTKS